MKVLRQHGASKSPAKLYDLAVISDGDTDAVIVAAVVSVGDRNFVLAWGDVVMDVPRGQGYALFIRRDEISKADGLSLIGKRFDSVDVARAHIRPMLLRG